MHEGSVRAIGVSNFNVPQLQQLLAVAKVRPALVQSNCDPLHQVCGGRGWRGRGGLGLGGVCAGLSRHSRRGCLGSAPVGRAFACRGRC